MDRAMSCTWVAMITSFFVLSPLSDRSDHDKHLAMCYVLVRS